MIRAETDTSQDGNDALVRDLQIDLLLGGCILFLFLFLFAAYEGIDLLDVLQLNSRHGFRLRLLCLRRKQARGIHLQMHRITAGLHTAAP